MKYDFSITDNLWHYEHINRQAPRCLYASHSGL